MNAIKALQAAPPEARALALTLLDQVSAPLTDRQLIAAFCRQGVGRSDARRMAQVLRKVDIIATTPRRT